jgi:hypothetical protein
LSIQFFVITRDEQFARALRFEADGHQEEARDIFAALGDVEALTALGRNLLTRPPIVSYDGVRAIVDAANKGGGEAVHLCGAMSALGAGMTQNWTMALDCVAASAGRGWRPAQDELRVLAASPGAEWKRLRDAIDIDALLEPGALRAVHEAPRISVAEKFLSPELCDWLIARAKPKIARARTFNAADGAIEESRNNSAAEFNFVEIDIVLALIRARIAALTGLAARGMENTQILHYAQGQRFAPHYDYLDISQPVSAKSVAESGQRIATFLVYLNDDFDGAETSFLTLDWRYRGARGDAIVFWNVDGAGRPDEATLHAGLAPTRGEKWLLSQWIRQAP